MNQGAIIAMTGAAMALSACDFAAQNAIAGERFHLGWIDRIGSNEIFNVDGREYEVFYLPVGVPYMQSRLRNGFLDPAAELEVFLYDSGVRTLEVMRANDDQFLPSDEKEARRVARQYCVEKDGWPILSDKVERTSSGTMSDKEFQFWNFVSFSHGRFRFPEICYEQ